MRSLSEATCSPFRDKPQTLQFDDLSGGRGQGFTLGVEVGDLAGRGYGAEVPDAELVAAVRAGENDAFERLYERYQRPITAYVARMVKDHGRAEDLTQEVFISALRRLRETEQPIAFKPWIYEIARNACIDQFRRSRRAEEISFDGTEGVEAGGYGSFVRTSPEPDAAIEQKMSIRHLQGAFGGLSDVHHEILVMRELEGLSYHQIGERLGMSLPAVESTLFRARKRLAEEYGELVSGERCLQVQATISNATSSAVGGRAGKRMARHISYCQPCRRYARLAGMDIAFEERRPLRAKVAAIFPLPFFLRRRSGGEDATSGLFSGHASTLAQWSASLGPLGDPSAVGGWARAAAATAALAFAGAGAGVATHTLPAPSTAHLPIIGKDQKQDVSSASRLEATDAGPAGPLAAPAVPGETPFGPTGPLAPAGRTGATGATGGTTAPSGPTSAGGRTGSRTPQTASTTPGSSPSLSDVASDVTRSVLPSGDGTSSTKTSGSGGSSSGNDPVGSLLGGTDPTSTAKQPRVPTSGGGSVDTSLPNLPGTSTTGTPSVPSVPSTGSLPPPPDTGSVTSGTPSLPKDPTGGDLGHILGR
jgi:RNA polymerase sigma factor (sigma-70 family)